MKLKLSFKCPDVVDMALEDVPEDEQDAARAACKKWVEYDEYLHVEIDTETGECTPLPV
jgi:hypothetical protein